MSRRNLYKNQEADPDCNGINVSCGLRWSLRMMLYWYGITWATVVSSVKCLEAAWITKWVRHSVL